MYMALQVEELHTDSSMEQVTMFDIQSESEQISEGGDQTGGCPFSK